METQYTKYVVQARDKSFSDAVWYDWHSSGTEDAGTLEEALKIFDKHYVAQCRDFIFRLVKREYVVKDAVVKV
jgi:hypothetical protein